MQVEISRKATRRFRFLPYLLLLPSLIVLCMFVFYPFVRNIVLSLTMTDVAGNVVKFVGLQNYERLFTSQTFLNSLTVSFRFALMVGIPTFILGFILALAATEQKRGSRIYETMYTMPLVIAAAPASVIWYMVYSPSGGLLNYLTGLSTNWLSSPQLAIWCVAAVTVWANLGLNVIFLLTGFRNVPAELLESAKIDGAGYCIRVRKIIIPLASPPNFLCCVLQHHYFLSNLCSSKTSYGRRSLLHHQRADLPNLQRGFLQLPFLYCMRYVCHSIFDYFCYNSCAVYL